MTTTSQTSVIKTRPYSHSSSGMSFYNIVVNAEDGNYQEFEIEASSFSEAEAQANRIAHETFTDITFVEIYKIA
ncbi:MAG: hypothetical protein K5683_02825 [Prevotella sp.]|nr:hypothetical protein [Prevotella sp.]